MITLRTALFRSLLGLLTLGGALAPARGAVVIVAPVFATTPGSMQITEDITFTITKPFSIFSYIVFEDLVQTNDGNSDGAGLTPNLAFTIYGSATTLPVSYFVDNSTPAFGDVTETDGYIGGNEIYEVSPGDTVTLAAGTYAIADNYSNFNPQTTQTFTGNMFLVDSDGKKISDVAAVPEPSAWALGGAGLLAAGAAGFRRAGRQAA